jgi:hypothetical protein
MALSPCSPVRIFTTSSTSYPKTFRSPGFPVWAFFWIASPTFRPIDRGLQSLALPWLRTRQSRPLLVPPSLSRPLPNPRTGVSIVTPGNPSSSFNALITLDSEGLNDGLDLFHSSGSSRLDFDLGPSLLKPPMVVGRTRGVSRVGGPRAGQQMMCVRLHYF